MAAFQQANTAALLDLGGADVMLQACRDLTFLNKYVLRYREALAGEQLLLPATLSQALTMRNGSAICVIKSCIEKFISQLL